MNISPATTGDTAKGQINQRGQQSPTREMKPGNGPGGCDAKEHIGRQGDGDHGQCQNDRMARVGICEQILPIDTDASVQGLHEYVDHGNDHQHSDHEQSEQRQTPPDPHGILLGLPNPARRDSLGFLQHGFSVHGACSSILSG
jgi:hypothetical protein